jgi:hypothetical protein
MRHLVDVAAFAGFIPPFVSGIPTRAWAWARPPD